MALITFPRLVRPNPLTSQVKYEGKLSKTLEHASRAIGVIISIAARLAEDETAMEETVAKVESILGQGVHYQILWNYKNLDALHNQGTLFTYNNIAKNNYSCKLTFNYTNYIN